MNLQGYWSRGRAVRIIIAEVSEGSEAALGGVQVAELVAPGCGGLGVACPLRARQALIGTGGGGGGLDVGDPLKARPGLLGPPVEVNGGRLGGRGDGSEVVLAEVQRGVAFAAGVRDAGSVQDAGSDDLSQ